jgi:hypothetical protein
MPRSAGRTRSRKAAAAAARRKLAAARRKAAEFRDKFINGTEGTKLRRARTKRAAKKTRAEAAAKKTTPTEKPPPRLAPTGRRPRGASAAGSVDERPS